MKLIFCLLLSAGILVCCAFAAFSMDPADPVMRVLVIDDKLSVHLRLSGKYGIYADNAGRMLMEGPKLDTRIRVAGDGFRIGSKDLKASNIMVRVGAESNVYIDGRVFRGDVEISRKENGRLMVINYVGLEDYLLGVLYHEVSHRWPMECLKAQAIASRTFALYQARANKSQVYDLRSDIYSQVYGGKNSEKWATTKAVNSTKGMVLTYRKDIFPTYFHATCAGRTEDASNLWKIDIEPLDGVACDLCKDSKHYQWTQTIPLEDAGEVLRQNGYKIGTIRTFSILSRSISGRVDKLQIKDGEGVTVVLTGKIFRNLFGPNIVRSSRFYAHVGEDNIILNGYGWGHGVGMCQWGAYGMSLAGKKADEILAHYYPGAEITTIEKIDKK